MAAKSDYQWSHAIIIDFLSSSDKSVRQIAAEALGIVGNAKTVEPLVKLLGDSDKVVRQTALDSLEKLGKPAVPQLIKALEDVKIRKYVARALGEIGDKQAIIPLSKIIDVEEWDTQGAVSAALKKLGHKTNKNKTNKNKTNETSKDLLKFLDAKDSAMRMMGLSMAKAAGLPDSVLGKIVGLNLWDTDANIRKQSAVLLNKEAPRNIREKLKEWKNTSRLVDPEKLEIIDVDLYYLGLQEARPFDKLQEIIEKDPPVGRHGNLSSQWRMRKDGATKLLGKMGTTKAVKPLILALNDRDLRFKAAEGLGKIGDKRAIVPLIKCLDDWNSDSIAKALIKFGESNIIEPLIKQLEITPKMAIGNWPGDPYLSPAAKSRRGAARVFVKIPPAKFKDSNEYNNTIKLLIKMLEDKINRPGIEIASVETLGKIGDESVVEPLIAVFKKVKRVAGWQTDDQIKVLEKSLITLSKRNIIQSSHTKFFLSLLKNEKYCNFAIGILGEIGDLKAVKPLIKILENTSISQAKAASLALGKIGDERAVRPLVKAFDRDNLNLTKSSAIAVLKIKGDDISDSEKIMKFLKNSDKGMVLLGSSMLKGVIE